ncbi:hypothetical protein QYE76_041127 [Lolium multiflorum]|uniref:GRF-type domain-containing protein n=1 Tax=Lolium multiflorum TaxID=4521 RepID=A0AAD8TEC9_LOLMU|nr:hypothetical protein QYE76_041127 [Lolium multiflorum]
MAAQFPACSGSSSRSGASSRRRRQPGKPIPYRQLPFDYEPADVCDCGEKMPQWISWSDPNPGRRYRNCKIRSIAGGIGCKVFKWVDDPLDAHHKQLVRDLRDAVWDRDEEIERLQHISNPSTSGMAKTGKKQLAEAPLTELEKARARTMMRNNRVFQSLGIPAIVSMIRKSDGGRGGGGSTLSDDESSTITQGESSDYHPSNDQLVDQEDGEVEGSIGEHIEKALKDPKSRKKKASVRKTSPGRRSKRLQKEQSSMPPGRVFADAPGGRKRHLEPVAEAPSKRVTRRTSSEASATNNEDTPPRNNRSSSPQIDERIDEASTVRRDTGPTASDVMVHQHFDSDGFLGPEVELDDEGKFLLDSCGTTAAGGRKRKGTGLEQICKGMGVKLTIEIPRGLKRPEKPLPAAKFASEGGMLARGQMPLLPHFKLYKRDENLLADFVGKMGANFNMDTESEDIQKACADILRKVSKNRRYILKRDYFDKVPANEVSIKSPVKDVSDEEWEALTALWVTPRHRNTCIKNKDSRAAVKFGQKTGSRSYAAHLYATREERRGEELDVVDIFKATHHNKKDGFSEEALAAKADMEAEMAIPVPEGAPPRSAVAVVAKVLTKEAKHSTFLKNAGLQPSSTVKLNKPTAAAVSAHVLDLEAQLKRSQEEAEQMKQQFAAIMEEAAAQKEKQAATEAAQAQRDKDFMELLKRTEESDRRVAHMLSVLGASGN